MVMLSRHRRVRRRAPPYRPKTIKKKGPEGEGGRLEKERGKRCKRRKWRRQEDRREHKKKTMREEKTREE